MGFNCKKCGLWFPGEPRRENKKEGLCSICAYQLSMSLERWIHPERYKEKKE